MSRPGDSDTPSGVRQLTIEPGAYGVAIRPADLLVVTGDTMRVFRRDLEHVVACYFCDDEDNDAVCERCGNVEPDLEIMERLREVLARSAEIESAPVEKDGTVG